MLFCSYLQIVPLMLQTFPLYLEDNSQDFLKHFLAVSDIPHLRNMLGARPLAPFYFGAKIFVTANQNKFTRAMLKMNRMVRVVLQPPSSGAGRSVFGGIKSAVQNKLAERGQKKQAEEFIDTIHELAQTSRYDLVAFEQYLDVSFLFFHVFLD